MELEINKFLCASTGHINEDEGENLDKKCTVVHEFEYGYFVYVGCPGDLFDECEMSDGFNQVVKIARENDCPYIQFDRDGPNIEGCETYDW